MNRLLHCFRPHTDYSPLPPSLNSPTVPPKRGNHRRHALVSALLILSAALNAFLFLCPRKVYPTLALDNYQALNHHPLIDASALPLYSANEPLDRAHDQHAVVTSLYTDTFAAAVATLGYSLRTANTTARLVLLYLPDRISPSALCIATASGFEPHAVTRIPPPHNGRGVYAHFLDQFTKLNVWTLDQIGVKSLVYLDADTLVRRNFDELFALPFMFGAIPDVFPAKEGFTLAINAGVLFLRPSTAIFDDMVSKLTTARYPLQDAEQSFLNHYFGAEVLRLPYHYNANLALKVHELEMWEGTRAEHRVVHFTLIKPFIGRGPVYKEVKFEDVEQFVEKAQEEDGGVFREEMIWWRETFKEMKTTYAERLARCPVM